MKIPPLDPVTGFPIATDAPGLSEPRQARSWRTLERLLVATAELLEDRTFHELTVNDVVARAGSSVGSFYARFADKDALLDHLDELYAREMVALLEEIAGDLEARPRARLRASVTEIVRRLVVYHRGRRGLLRALVLRARERREPRYEERTGRMNRALPRLLRQILAHADEIGHEDAEAACRLGFSMVFSALRDRILFPESVRLPEPPDDERLIAELTHLLVAYLVHPSEAPS